MEDSRINDEVRETFEKFIKVIISEWTKESKTEITGSQYFILDMLFKHGPMTMSDIARELDVTQSAVTLLADKLNEKNFIKRVRLETDRRIIKLHITVKGINFVEKIKQKRKEKLEKIHKNLTYEEMIFLSNIYKKILSNYIS